MPRWIKPADDHDEVWVREGDHRGDRLGELPALGDRDALRPQALRECLSWRRAIHCRSVAERPGWRRPLSLGLTPQAGVARGGAAVQPTLSPHPWHRPNPSSPLQATCAALRLTRRWKGSPRCIVGSARWRRGPAPVRRGGAGPLSRTVWTCVKVYRANR